MRSCGKRENDRIKAVLLRNESWSTPMISQALCVQETSVVRFIDDYLDSEKLTIESGGSGSHLPDDQTQELIQYLCAVTYLHTHQIVAHIKENMASLTKYRDLISGYISITSVIKTLKMCLISLMKRSKPSLLRATSS